MSNKQTPDSSTALPSERLQKFIVDAFYSLGVPTENAVTAAALMVEADILGYGTHGVFRLRQYLARLRDGGCNPNAQPAIIRETAATALIDGDNGLGHLAMRRACELAMDKAQTAGIGWVGIRRGNHAGPLALYVRPQAQADMIGMAAAVGSANHVPPYGGTDLLLGTNPIAISSPTGTDDPFVLDMATTVAAMGKIKVLAQNGENMPEGWMVGKDGKPLTDPALKSEGFMLPIGGPKGFGLSVAVGILAGALNDAAFGSDVVDFTKDTTSETNTGQFVMALDVSAFSLKEQFVGKAEKTFDEMRASTPLPGYAKVRLPGEGKSRMADEARISGVKLSNALMQDLHTLAEEYGLETP